MDNPGQDTVSNIHLAAEILRHGGVIAYPTETVWGLGCDPFNEAACERILQLKGRNSAKTMLLLAADRMQVERIAGSLEGLTRIIAEQFWPGPLTLVLHVRKSLPAHLLGPTGGVAFRVSPDPLAAAIAQAFDCPIVSTSANISGEPPFLTYESVLSAFGTLVDLVVPSKNVLSGVPSTVVDLTGEEPVVLREGAISRTMLDKVRRQ